MKSYKLIIIKIILGLFFCNKYISQKSKSKEIVFFQSKNKLEIDQYGNFYLINKDDLTKCDINGTILYRYSNKLLGNIDHLDVSNPLRPLLFYKDQGVIIVLDNTLSQQENQISLNEMGLYQTNCIANSNFDNGIWLYDLDVNEIIKINQNSKITYKSGNLSVLVPETDFQVISLKEKNRNLFVVTPSKLLIIDQFGSLIKTLNLSAKKGLIIKEDDLISYDGQYIYKYNFLDYKLDTLVNTNNYFKILGFQNKIIGISRDQSMARFLNLTE